MSGFLLSIATTCQARESYTSRKRQVSSYQINAPCPGGPRFKTWWFLFHSLAYLFLRSLRKRHGKDSILLQFRPLAFTYSATDPIAGTRHASNLGRWEPGRDMSSTEVSDNHDRGRQSWTGYGGGSISGQPCTPSVRKHAPTWICRVHGEPRRRPGE